MAKYPDIIYERPLSARVNVICSYLITPSICPLLRTISSPNSTNRIAVATNGRIKRLHSRKFSRPSSSRDLPALNSRGTLPSPQHLSPLPGLCFPLSNLKPLVSQRGWISEQLKTFKHRRALRLFRNNCFLRRRWQLENANGALLTD